jgi:hypothetical protein
MNRTAEADVTGAPGVAPAAQLVALRGELWQRHVLLQGMDRDDEHYEDASLELLELTAELLRVEAEVGEVKRAARRRAGRIGFSVASVLLLAAGACAMAAPVLGVLTSQVAAGSVLLLAAVVLAVTVAVRRRNAPERASDGRGSAGAAEVPDTAPRAVPELARD